MAMATTPFPQTLIQTRLQAAPTAPWSPGAWLFAPGQVWAQRSRCGSGRGRTCDLPEGPGSGLCVGHRRVARGP